MKLTNMPSRIICGFPGVGKSTFVREYKRAIDLDSALFPKDANFVDNYIKQIENHFLSERFFNHYILVSTHKELMGELAALGIRHYVVYPDIDISFETWSKRWKARGDKEEWIDYMEEHWDAFKQDIQNHLKDHPDYACGIALGPDKHLIDVIERIEARYLKERDEFHQDDKS